MIFCAQRQAETHSKRCKQASLVLQQVGTTLDEREGCALGPQLADALQTTTIKTEKSSAMTQMDAKRKKNTTYRIRLVRKSEGNGACCRLLNKNIN